MMPLNSPTIDRGRAGACALASQATVQRTCQRPSIFSQTPAYAGTWIAHRLQEPGNLLGNAMLSSQDGAGLHRERHRSGCPRPIESYHAAFVDAAQTSRIKSR